MIATTVHHVHVDTADRSEIMSLDMMQLIASWIPLSHSSRPWILKYSLRRDGASLDTVIVGCEDGNVWWY